MNKRALYNSLRMNWLLDPSDDIPAWQVADYRSIATKDLFSQLSPYGIEFDEHSFEAFAEEEDSPEELTEALIGDASLTPEQHDFIYLLVFELWRRLLPEHLSLSIFCDEADHLIFEYDQGNIRDLETIEDMLSNLLMLLEDSTDEGVDPHEAFASLSDACANDVENFILDFIHDQIDAKNKSYAAELIENFAPYLPDPKWLDYSQARIFADTDPLTADLIIRQLVENAVVEEDLEFNFALLSLLIHQGDEEVFVELVKHTLTMISIEEDFQELLTICADHYRLLDADQQESQVQSLLEKRASLDLEKEIDVSDPDFKVLDSIVK